MLVVEHGGDTMLGIMRALYPGEALLAPRKRLAKK
jgi:hypothetical protein